MPITCHAARPGAFLTIRVIGRIAKADYVAFVPEFERAVKLDGKVRVLFDLTAFEGWDVGALWQELKFDFKYFDHSDLEGAQKWLGEA